ncbi:MAG: tetratricopeptide repeat protein [Prevotella sp.]|nr:tetratricopeptide repeat protein [Prevotella sp.]
MANKKQQEVLDVNETLNKSEAFILKYKKPIIAAVVALIAIIAALFIYQNYISGPREDKASTALGRGQEYFNAEQFDKALNGDGANYAGFLKIASDYSSTDAGNLANLYAGLCYANLGKWEDAVKYLDQFSPADDAVVSPAAVAALGNAYAHVKQLDKAVSALKKAADMADKKGVDGVNNSIAPTFRLQAAQIVESQGNKDEALKMYQDIKKKYVNSALVQSQEIDKYIQRLESK